MRAALRALEKALRWPERPDVPEDRELRLTIPDGAPDAAVLVELVRVAGIDSETWGIYGWFDIPGEAWSGLPRLSFTQPQRRYGIATPHWTRGLLHYLQGKPSPAVRLDALRRLARMSVEARTRLGAVYVLGGLPAFGPALRAS